MVLFCKYRQHQKSLVPSRAAQKFDRRGQYKKTKSIRANIYLLLDHIRRDVYDGEVGHSQEFDLERQFYSQKQKGRGAMAIYLRKLCHQK